MKFSKDKAKSHFDTSRQKVSKQDVEDAVMRGKDKMNELESNMPGVLKKMWADIKLMMSLIGDYAAGEYTEVPWRVITAITAAMLYFISPIDLIPDFILVIGFLDDAFVIKLALDFSADDLQRYANWKEGRVDHHSYTS